MDKIKDCPDRGHCMNEYLIEELYERAEAAERELAALKERTRWIPISERLPEDGEVVLAKHKVINSIYDWIYMASQHDYFYEHFTHWMPRPDLPEVG